MAFERAGFTLAATSVLALAACRAEVQAPEMGKPLPEFALPDLKGQTIRLSDFRGKVVVLNFWASWCPPCIAEMPSLERLHRALADKGLQVLAISVDDNLDDVVQFKEHYQLTFPILHDKARKASEALLTFKYPETYVVDREGNLAWKVIGPIDWVSPEAIHNFVQMLGSGSD